MLCITTVRPGQSLIVESTDLYFVHAFEVQASRPCTMLINVCVSFFKRGGLVQRILDDYKTSSSSRRALEESRLLSLQKLFGLPDNLAATAAAASVEKQGNCDGDETADA
ncbi:unnamed protein product [Schistocephalus solidus]|uniref:Uncharacterized protein n=1 Tax=Schistocephalus solidus TaxID=70667 RepID=A0A3P7DJB3_SCHSO|nr:unnamed protein product [Schistocephalus solidus]